MGVIRDIRDWFHERGDDFFGIDKKVENLELHQLLPDEVGEILDRLDEKHEDAMEVYKESDRAYREAAEKREQYYREWRLKDAEFKAFKEEHHGIIGMFIYNWTPLRFFTVGREYQRLKKEIKMEKRQHKFWSRCADEKNHIFEQAVEYRKEAKRALSEYKRIIVSKAKMYKKEFKLYAEYEKLNLAKGYKRIDREFGRDITDKLDNFLYYIRENWFDKPFISAGFDVKAVTKAVIDITRGKRLNETEIAAMRGIQAWTIKPVNGPRREAAQTNERPQENETENQQQQETEQENQQQNEPQQDEVNNEMDESFMEEDENINNIVFDEEPENEQAQEESEIEQPEVEAEQEEPENEESEQADPRKLMRGKQKPPVEYGKYNLDRRAVESVIKTMNLNLTPEEFMIAVAISNKNSIDIADLSKRVKAATMKNPDDARLKKLAQNGAEIVSEMIKENPDEKFNFEALEDYIDVYKVAKNEIDKNSAQSRENTQNQK